MIVFIALRGVPPHLRDSVQGDLLEQRGGPREALAIALHFQAEPYRAAVDLRSVLLLLLAAACVLGAVPLAAHNLLVQAAVFYDAFSQAVLQVWRAPAVLAAVAAGLLIGGAPGLARHADAARWHLVLLLTPAAALAAPGAVQALLAAVLLPASAWLAQHRRRLPSDPLPGPAEG